MAVGGVSRDDGFTDFSLDDVAVKQAALHSARRCVVACDSAKIGKVGFARIGGLGVAIERFAYRPLRNAPRIAPLITAIGVSFFLENSAQLLFGAQYRVYNTSEFISLSSGIQIGSVTIDSVQIMVLVLALLLMVGLQQLVNRTRLGRMMRAVAVDREAAEMLGISVRTIRNKIREYGLPPRRYA